MIKHLIPLCCLLLILCAFPGAAQSVEGPYAYLEPQQGDALNLVFQSLWPALTVTGLPLADVNQGVVFRANVEHDPMLPDNPINKKKHKKKSKYDPKRDNGGRN